jgi:uncharacterized membrane protein
MAFCSNCGTEAHGAFCPNCGTAIGAGPTSAPPLLVSAGGLEPHIAGALCYTPLLIGLVISIVFLFVPPYNQNKFVRFCSFQSLFLHLAAVVAFFILGILSRIRFVGWIFGTCALFVWIGALVLFLFLMYKSFNNQKLKLPYIGDMADKQA